MKRIVLLLAVTAVVVAMLAVGAGTALGAPGNNGKGATNANPNASSGINNAVVKSGSGCTLIC